MLCNHLWDESTLFASSGAKRERSERVRHYNINLHVVNTVVNNMPALLYKNSAVTNERSFYLSDSRWSVEGRLSDFLIN